MGPQKYLNIFYRYVAVSVILLALIGVGFAFIPKVTQFRNYQQTKKMMKADIRAKEEQIKESRHNQERFSTDKYFVQKIAHEIGFAHENEVIFQFNDQPDTNNPMASSSGTGN